MCKTPAIADIVILVDGSWSIGRINFRLVRTFLENLVRAFSVEFDKTRIGEDVVEFCAVWNVLLHWDFLKQWNFFSFVCAGLAQYSGDPRIEWHLKTHTTKAAVMDAVKNLPYKGGNTLTGTVSGKKQEDTYIPVFKSAEYTFLWIVCLHESWHWSIN